MIKYFYLVEFEYKVTDDYSSGFNLGVFSNKNLANKKIEMSAGLPGFNQYSIKNFEITKFGVNFDTDIKDKSKITLYWVTHEYDNDCDGFTYYSEFNYFSTMEKAEKHVEYLQKHNKIGKKYPNNFEIVEVYVDNFNSWVDGFEKLDK